MDRLLRSLLSLKDFKYRRDDDFCDRLSRQYTSSLMVLFAIIVSTKQFVGDPISCWCPAHFTESHRTYTNTICWVSNTFYVPMAEKVPDGKEDLWGAHQMISYYQWVPLIMLLMAMLAHIPSLVWRFLNVRSGLDVTALMDAANVCQRATHTEVRERTVRYMVNQIDRHLLAQRDYRRNCCIRMKQIISRYCFFIGGKRHGNYLMWTYMLVKVLYVANAVGQLFILDEFLGMDYHVYGIQVVARLFRGEDWSVSDRFPRVTLCNFQIRHQSRVHDYVVQCALTINIFNEKIFILIWFWYVFLAICTVVSFFRWVWRALYWPSQIRYIKKKLRSFEITHRSKGNLRKFVQFYLRRDGIFLIRLLSLNIGELVASETLCGLWESYGPDRRMMTEQATRPKRAMPAGTNTYPGASGTTGNQMEVV